MLFLLHNHVATYQICWTGPMKRSTGAHNRLLAETVDHLTAKGFHRLDLGTVDTANAPVWRGSSSDQGVTASIGRHMGCPATSTVLAPTTVPF